MKLRNKKTGEIIDIKDALWDSDDYPNHYLISTDWEDAPEEPKEYWIPMSDEPYPFVGNDWEKEGLATGLISLSKEENDRKRQKLKAWQRLKDKGLSFRHWKEAPLRPHSSCIAITGNMDCDAEAREDLDLLFSEDD